MKYLLAVSGGIDSVVMLDMLARRGEHELIVAHFDHGIREDSHFDAAFVGELARQYNLPFIMAREELGKDASEDLARTRRYTFLRASAEREGAVIATAHHADDIIETVAINLLRGTGWRGLAVLDAPDVVRPLLAKTKQDNIRYALKHRLEWVEDSTNQTDAYLRNRIRRRLGLMSQNNKVTILALWRRQISKKRLIEEEITSYVSPAATYSRYFMIMIPSTEAVELLRWFVYSVCGSVPTRPQAERAVLAIKTAQPQTVYQVGDGIQLRFTRQEFIVEAP